MPGHKASRRPAWTLCPHCQQKMPIARGVCGATLKSGRPCQRPAGANTPHLGYGQCSRHGGNTESGIKWAARLRAEDEVRKSENRLKPPTDPRNPREVAAWILERDVERVAQIEGTLRQAELDMATRLILMARSLAERREAGQHATTMHKNNLYEEHERNRVAQVFMFIFERAPQMAGIEWSRADQRRYLNACAQLLADFERAESVIDATPIPLRPDGGDGGTIVGTATDITPA